VTVKEGEPSTSSPYSSGFSNPDAANICKSTLSPGFYALVAFLIKWAQKKGRISKTIFQSEKKGVSVIESSRAKGRYTEHGSAQFKKWCKLAGSVGGKEGIKEALCLNTPALTLLLHRAF
jgi:hypothetical protein